MRALGLALVLPAFSAFAQPSEPIQPVACPEGEVSSPATQGHCCGPRQVWSADGRCVDEVAPPPSPAAPAPNPEAAAAKELAPLAPVSFNFNGGLLFGGWLGFQLGVQVQIPVWQPLRGRHVGGYLFVAPEGSFLYFQQSRPAGNVYTVGGLFAVAVGWHQRLGPLSVVPRVGPGVVIANQWGAVTSDTAASAVGVAGVEVHLRLGRFGLMVGGDYLFGANQGLWLLRIGFGL